MKNKMKEVIMHYTDAIQNLYDGKDLLISLYNEKGKRDYSGKDILELVNKTYEIVYAVRDEIIKLED